MGKNKKPQEYYKHNSYTVKIGYLAELVGVSPRRMEKKIEMVQVRSAIAFFKKELHRCCPCGCGKSLEASQLYYSSKCQYKFKKDQVAKGNVKVDAVDTCRCGKEIKRYRCVPSSMTVRTCGASCGAKMQHQENIHYSQRNKPEEPDNHATTTTTTTTTTNNHGTWEGLSSKKRLKKLKDIPSPTKFDNMYGV